MASSDVAALVRAGRLRYKLHSGQKKAYDDYRRWEKAVSAKLRAGEVPEGEWPKIYVFNCSRRFGKDFLSLLIRTEDCIRNPKGLYSYGTAYGKDIAEIVIPLMEQICADFPPALRPTYKQAYMGTSSAYYFLNGSVLRLVGLDSNPDGLRGRHSDGMTFSEAGYVAKLKVVVQQIVLPQFLGHHDATLILNSTPPEEPAHPYKIDFIPDAIKRGAYQKFTIYDNPLLTEVDIKLAIASGGGLEGEVTRREYFCEDIRSETRTIVPEFSRARHVVDNPAPPFALGYTVVDPGVRDLCAVLCGFYDFGRAKLVVVSDWAERNATAAEVAKAILECEQLAFKDLTFWKDRAFGSNPFIRVSDTDSRMILELNRAHGIKIGPVDKEGADAARNSLRHAFHQDRIEIRTTAPTTALHVEGGIWNKSRTDYERSDALGHVDALDALIYMWKTVNQNFNPTPPHGIMLQKDVPLHNIFYKEDYMRRENPLLAAAKKLLPSRGIRPR